MIDRIRAIKIESWLSFLVVLAVVIIAIVSFVLSYQVLANEASAAGVYTPRLFPIIVDLGLVAFIATRLLATIRGIPDARAWAFWAVVGATVTSILLNVAHAVDFGAWVWSIEAVISVIYFIIPPVALAVCSELLAMLLHHTATNQKPEPTEGQRLVIGWVMGNVSDEQMAETAGVNPATIRRWAVRMGIDGR